MDARPFIPNGLDPFPINGDLDNNKICTVDDFLAHIPDNGDGLKCQEFDRVKSRDHQLRIFAYRPAEIYTPPTVYVLVEMKVQALISSMQIWKDDVLVQFWTPKRFINNNGVLMPSASQQPFGLKILRYGLCKYRYLCSNHMFNVRDHRDLGPPGRVFTSRSPELCENIRCYSPREFPLRDVALSCGINSYQAYPLFQRWDNQQRCVGVLEFLSFNGHVYPLNLENRDFTCTTSSHSPECKKVHCNYVSPYRGELQILKNVILLYNRIQFWVPCTCENGNGSFNDVTQLFCQLPWFHRDTKYSLDLHHLNFVSTTFFVKNGKNWVGKACFLNKVCFFSDTSRSNITEYPLVHLIRSTSLISSCFVIPLTLIHPKLPPLILEAFIPQIVIRDENMEEKLTELLTEMAKNLSKHNVSFKFKNKEKFVVELSHSDDENFVYFNVSRREESSGSMTNKQAELPIIQYGQNFGGDYQDPETLEKGGSSFTNDIGCEITLDIIKSYFGRNIGDAAKELKVSLSTLKRRCRTFGIKRWPSHKRFSKVKNHNKQTPTKALDEEGDSNPELDQKSIAGAREKSTDSISMTMSATYKDDVVMFPFHINSGIEELRVALAKRFDLGTDENFKIKFEDEGDWILISCDEDMHFNMPRLKSSGQTVVNISVEIKKSSIGLSEI